MIEFIIAHKAALSGLGIGILDLVFALKSSWKSNGILHYIYLSLGGKE